MKQNNTFKTGDRVRTKFGEIGTVRGLVFTGHVSVEIDNSEDKQKVKRWLGNITENYSPHELEKT